MKRILLSILSLLSSSLLFAQGHIDILPTMSNQTLLTNLVAQYKPITVLTYGQARDTMFGKIYNVNDSITCVYSGYKRYLDPSQDPTQYMYGNDPNTRMDTEHTCPQSKGATGNAKSDLHHLFPSKSTPNNGRGSSPFAELDDNNVDKWYYLSSSGSGMPPMSVRYLYSELDTDIPAFEPREDHKGNVARAMFYFYTMYKAEADNADPTYFSNMQNMLCDWHIQDPVDQKEWDRTYIIAKYQSNKPNPFVLDCTLPERTYCPSISCTPTSINRQSAWGVEFAPIYPNPVKQNCTIAYELHRSQNIQIHIFNSLGQKVFSFDQGFQNEGKYQQEINLENLHKGIYFVQLQMQQGQSQSQLTKSFVKQ